MKAITNEEFKKYKRTESIFETIENVQNILATIRVGNTHLTFAVQKDEQIHHIESIELAKEGGVYVNYANCPFQRKGFAHSPSVTAIDNVKKVMIGLASGFSSFRGKSILLFFCLLFRRRIFRSFDELLNKLYTMVRFHRLKPEWYCKAAREMYNAIDHVIIRDIFTLIMEFDDAYRYRFQDVLGELNHFALTRNPITEIGRMFELLAERETDERLKRNWKMARKLLFVVFFFKDVREPIIRTFSRLNPQHLKLDEADLYFASLKKDGYNWGGTLQVK